MIRFALLINIIFLSISSIFCQSINQVDGQGNKQGIWIKTYASGQTRYKGQFRNNRPYGEFIYYNHDGLVEARNKFSDDGIISHSIIYHSNGKILAEGKYVNQKKDGVWMYYSDLDGKLVAEENYNKGKLDGESKTFYAETGELFEIMKYRAGIKQGTYQKYFPDGKIMTEGFYLDGLLDGEFVSYYPDGNIQLRGNHRKGMQVGNWEYFDEEGSLLTEDEYKKGNVDIPEKKR